MRLRVVSKLSQRAISNLELLFKFVFGDKFPELFEPGKNYQKGDIIFILDENGNPKILQCVVEGSYTHNDLTNKNYWSEVTVSDVISSGATEEIVKELQKIIGNLNDYQGDKQENVINIANHLFNKIEFLISNFPEHNSQVDGGAFEGDDILPPNPDPELPPGALEAHDTSEFAHENIWIDGNEGGNDITFDAGEITTYSLEDEESRRMRKIYGEYTYDENADFSIYEQTGDILDEHNNNPKAHTNIIIDGNIG